MKIDPAITPQQLAPAAQSVFALAIKKIGALNTRWNPQNGSPVFTINGQYATRGWTEWTQGFQFGLPLLAFEATNDEKLLDLARDHILQHMSPHITHTGVHDHGFNNISTYGNLRRLMLSGRIPHNSWELRFYNLALAASGSVQGLRWSTTADSLGYVYSFNGPHSLFVDTIRSMRVLALAHQLGHRLLGENDQPISLLGRAVHHGLATAKYNIYYGAGRDSYDLPAMRGRTVHESIFNRNDCRFRCPSSQQGYSPFSTWTRGLAWAVLGFAEQLEFLSTLPAQELADAITPKVDISFDPNEWAQLQSALGQRVLTTFEEAARATADFYIANSALDGVPYWDTGAPGLASLDNYLERPANPFNLHEPVDSSAAAIAAQGMLRLGRHLRDPRYTRAALTIAKTLFAQPYLATDGNHEGLLLHTVYHRPNGWDHVPPNRKVPCNESCMWGDYHLLELALLIAKMSDGAYFTFFDSAPDSASNRK